MIYYLVTGAHTYTMWHTLESIWGKSFRQQVKILPYETCLKAKRLPTGSYIFSDIERLTPSQSERAAQIWQALAEVSPTAALLNHPTQSFRRYQLLRNLYEAGINQFNVYRLTEARQPQSFPVFIREEDDHTGPKTELLNNQAELDAAIDNLNREGKSLVDKIITEFCPTADANGVTRKYSALILGERILPRHIFFSTQTWMLKVPDLTEPKFVAEETEYLTENPHLEQLRSIFAIAKINFGRIDYGCVNGKVQVWEINTNPFLLWPMQNEPAHAARLANHAQFAEQMVEALLEFNTVSKDIKPSKILLPPSSSWLRNLAIKVNRSQLPYHWKVWLKKQYDLWQQAKSAR